MATTEQFSLRWNNFHSNLTSGFHELLEAAEMVDVTLAVDGHFFQAHKIVLSICSPYFKQMFKVNPCKHPIVILKDVGHENMKDILEFMYMGEVSVLRENLTQFLRTAELLQVKGLTGDDSSEEASSTKDNKADCDNDEENDIYKYNQLIEADVELPIYSSSPAQVASALPVVKRPSKNTSTSTNAKRSKSDGHQSHSNQQKPVKCENSEPVKFKNEYNNSDFVNMDSHASQNALNTPKAPEGEENKETLNMKNIWENSIGAASSGDMNSSDQAVSFLVALPTTRLKTNLILFARVSTTLVIGFLLLINNFGQEWEVADIKTKTPYKAGTGQEINASISMKIGFRCVNVTLKATTPPEGVLQREIIDYNERFEWTWDQGRFGFGPYAGHLQRQFRAAQYRGLPTPILWIVEYFVIDGEGFRFGRFYRTAGWYSHILLWTAFACWLVANILFRSVIRYGAYFLAICGGLQLVANLVWLVVRNPIPLKIPFEDDVLVTKFGFNYWATFFMGIVCLLISGTIFFMDYKFDDMLYELFGINPLNSYDEVAYLTKEERLLLRNKNAERPMDIPLVEMTHENDRDEPEDEDYIPVYLKRKTIAHAPKISRSNKPRHLGPFPVPT